MIGSKLFKIIKDDKGGLSIIEMVTALAIFSFLIVVLVSVFQSLLNGQQSAISAQNIQESMHYVFEVISKEVRTAQEGGASLCDLNSGTQETNKIYNTDSFTFGDYFYFLNQNGDCVAYFLKNNEFAIIRGSTNVSATPNDIKITSLKFHIEDNTINTENTIQPRVTISISAEANTNKEIHKQKMIMQSTISTRSY